MADYMDDADNHQPPRLQEVEGNEGMPGELIDTPNNEPGSQELPDEVTPSETPISDAKGTS